MVNTALIRQEATKKLTNSHSHKKKKKDKEIFKQGTIKEESNQTSKGTHKWIHTLKTRIAKIQKPKHGGKCDIMKGCCRNWKKISVIYLFKNGKQRGKK